MAFLKRFYESSVYLLDKVKMSIVKRTEIEISVVMGNMHILHWLLESVPYRTLSPTLPILLGY